MSYADCIFFAEKTSAHKGAALAGTVLVVARNPSEDMINGSCVAAIGVPKGEPNAVPARTWTSAEHLARRCVEINEADARRLAPRMFAALEAYDRAPEYRASYLFAMVEAIRSRRYVLQSADDTINAAVGGSTPEETDGPTGWTHRGARRRAMR